MKKLRLKTFLIGSSNPAELMPGCASYDNGECLFSDSCDVLSGRRCKYFEAAVLPTAADIGQADNIAEQYKKQVGGIESGFDPIEGGGNRRCDCGQPLVKGKQLCPKCRKKRRRESNRQSIRRYRGSM